MVPESIRKNLRASVVLVFLVPALCSCISNDSSSPKVTNRALGTAEVLQGTFESEGGLTQDANMTGLYPSVETEKEIQSRGGSTSTDTMLTHEQQTPQANEPTGQLTSVSGSKMSDGEMHDNPLALGSVPIAGTELGSSSLSERPRSNPEAADLLDHWRHRHIQSIVEALRLNAPTPEADGAELKTLRSAVQSRGQELLAPGLHGDDEVRVLGSDRGITYGRWTGGPADSLSIDFDFSYAGPTVKDDPELRATVERAGKVWSNRIADTWSVWRWSPGAIKGTIMPGLRTIEAGPDGETSTGLQIIITDGVGFGSAGRAATDSRISPTEDAWEPRFGSLQLNREHIDPAEDANVFRIVAHEIGHVLGAWQGGDLTKPYADYSDTANGTWTGPNVMAVHGGPVPFQDATDPAYLGQWRARSVSYAIRFRAQRCLHFAHVVLQLQRCAAYVPAPRDRFRVPGGSRDDDQGRYRQAGDLWTCWMDRLRRLFGLGIPQPASETGGSATTFRCVGLHIAGARCHRLVAGRG